MKIHTKLLNGQSDYMLTIDALFEYAKEILGDDWTFTHSQNKLNSSLTFRDSAGKSHGWHLGALSGPAFFMSEDVHSEGSAWSVVCSNFGDFTGVVLEFDGGSVGIGYQDGNGKYVLWYLLIKFNGNYAGKELYGVSMAQGVNQRLIIKVHGNVDIGIVNTSMNSSIGSGVYLHSLYDPVSGLISSDILGVQSMDSAAYRYPGTVVKQGGVSYLAILSDANSNASSANNVIFAKI